MKILVIGSGGREHALVWKMRQSPQVSKVYAAPGNGGMHDFSEVVHIPYDDIRGLVNFARQESIDLTVVGPEVPLAMGIVDEFQLHKLRIFGPTKELAQLEASKVFAKELMYKLGVPTADFKVFSDSERAREYVEKMRAPIVVKADGLAAGKGVIVAKTVEEALGAITLIMDDKIFKDAGRKVVIEKYLVGEEASILVITDGKEALPLASSQDHKRIFDGDKGPNTGGMGAYSPAPVVGDKMQKVIMDKIIYPVIRGLAKEGKRYKGVLYAGIMITDEGPKVLEFNTRFGDPEIQAILPRLKTDLVVALEAAIDGKIDRVKLEWDERFCVCVVISSDGYPGEYRTGYEIHGLDEVAKMKDVIVFHAGTRREIADATHSPWIKTKLLTNGGRVLNVVGLGDSIRSAINRTYEAVGKIHFDNMYYRKDIAKRAIGRTVAR